MDIKIYIRNLYAIERQYNFKNLQVYYTAPLNTDKSQRLGNGNLMILCEHHYYLLCEKANIFV